MAATARFETTAEQANAASDVPAGDGGGLLAADFSETPYWWDDAPAPVLPAGEPARVVDVAIVGSGYTGLNAALETARAGRSTLVVDAEQAGWGCSTRNGGQISTSVKPMAEDLASRYGAERARAIHGEGRTALEWIEELVRREGIECDFQRKGRYHAAHTPDQFTALASRIEAQRREGIEAHMVPRAEQRSELGTDTYHGGVVYPRHAALHPAKYHTGLLKQVIAAGAQVVPYCPVLSIERNGSGFELQTPSGAITARDVVVATNGYSGALLPWLRRRIIPIGSYIIATEPLPPGVMDRLFPTDRIASDTCRVVYYYRASPDRRRVLFGGRVSARESEPRVSAPRLHADMCRIFPELSATRVSHSWSGTVAYSFDSLAHCGIHDGIHYAASYCGSGVSMASYLGMRTGQRVLGLKEGRTAFDDLPFPTRPLYSGTPWFLPTVVAWYRWRDQRECARAANLREGVG
ncbi:MAG TPA: FAD-dependent oxidoreductase [Thermohalobaculum sp.]|nr:FAD-dependent oxidoreductase [Thermohalobaculum sp.]